MTKSSWITDGIARLGEVLNAAGSLQYGRLSQSKDKPFAHRFSDLIPRAKEENQWFSQENTQYALLAYGEMLKQAREAFSGGKDQLRGTMAIIPSGLFPFDGLEDIALSLLSGYKVQIKQRSKNDLLIPAAIETLQSIYPGFGERIQIEKGAIRGFDKILSRMPQTKNHQWQKYFGKYAGELRGWPSTTGIITGKETLNQLEEIANGILRYFKQSPDNITKLHVPSGYSLKMMDEAFVPFEREMKQHTQWFNNYEYQKSLAILNSDQYHDNGFVLFKHNSSTRSPAGVVHIESYAHTGELESHVLNDHPGLCGSVVSVKDQPFCPVISPARLLKPGWNNRRILHTLKKINE